MQKQRLYDLAGFLADAVGIFDELHLFGLFEYTITLLESTPALSRLILILNDDTALQRIS